MGKRGHNEGSIYRRESDGKWVGSVNLGYGLNGKRKRKVIYGATRKEVSEKLKVLLRDQQQGLPIALERQTMSQFLNRWLEETVKPTVRPSTYTGYEVLVRVHILPPLGHIQLSALTAQDIQTFLNEKSAEGLSPRTVQYARAVLRRALGQAVKWGLVVRNVATLVDPPAQRQHDIHALTPEEARIFLAAIKGHRLEALYTVAIALGLRRGEALGLQWDDVNLDAGTLVVRRSLQRVGGKLLLTETKTNRSRRTIAMPVSLVVALKAHKAHQIEERLLVGEQWQDSGLVFTSTVGTPLEPRNVNRQFDGLLKKAGLAHIRFHDLRHTAASLLLAQGVHPRVVMEILGHSKISVTMDTYSHVIPALNKEAANRIEELLNGTE